MSSGLLILQCLTGNFPNALLNQGLKKSNSRAMKKLPFILLISMISMSLTGQTPGAITIDPPDATAYDELTLTFDPDKACFENGSLDGLPNIAMHSGVTLSSGEQWQFPIEYNSIGANGQSTTLLPTADGRFSITYTPAEYYGLNGETVTQICAVFNNGIDWSQDGRDFVSGSSECRDFYIPINTGSMQSLEVHEFGSTSSEWYIYSDGKKWNFTAQNNMLVETIDVKSVLAAFPPGGTIHIEIRIDGDLVANWDQFVANVTYHDFYHSKDVNLNLYQGDAIQYKIYGGTFYDPIGAIRGVNYVKLSNSVGVEDRIDKQLIVSHNYPNPFNQSTTIAFLLSQHANTTITVFNQSGQEIKTVFDGSLMAGEHNIQFDGSDIAGGIYYYTIRSGKHRGAGKMLLLK
jgi:hypothetical protein